MTRFAGSADVLRKGMFLLLAAAFFLLPWLVAPLRNQMPGMAVICGIIFAVGWGNPFERFTAGITSPLLGVAIVGLGCGMNLLEVLRAGAHGFLYTFIGIALGLGLGVWLGKRLGLQKNTMYLISVGTAICGGSAIAAAAPVLKAKSHDIALASAVVFTLNAVALLLFPMIGHLLELNEYQFGCWAALGIHDTSSVVGASMAYGPEALAVGTTMKLARALWIVPVTMFLAMFVASRAAGEKRRLKFKVPWFIPGFLIASALVTWVPATAAVGLELKELSKYLMVLTLFLIGGNLSRSKLRELGMKSVLHGVLLWLILAAIWCVAICCHLVR